MGDPLSVAASIGGLVALAGQLYVALDDFITIVRDAPALASTVRSEIKSFRNSLHALQGILHDPSFRGSRRAALISADYIVVSFTDAVLVFSQLETNIFPLTRFTENGLAMRMQWTRKKSKVNELVSRLQWQKHTLSLQLNILKCASDLEAERDRQALDTLIHERLEEDRDMERRLQIVEERLRSQHDSSFCDRSSVITTRSNVSDNLTIRADNVKSSDAPNTIEMKGRFQHAFEESLNASWVYRRNWNREEDMSIRSSILRPSAWSALSELSLANISIITVKALPVHTQEISNLYWYTKGAVVSFGLPDQLNETLESSKQDTAPVQEAVDVSDSDAMASSPDLNEFTPAQEFIVREIVEIEANETPITADDNFGSYRSMVSMLRSNCSTCGKKIEVRAILTGASTFCEDCFRCDDCKMKILRVRYYWTSQAIFCVTCYEDKVAMWKKVEQKKKATVEVRPTWEGRKDDTVKELHVEWLTRCSSAGSDAEPNNMDVQTEIGNDRDEGTLMVKDLLDQVEDEDLKKTLLRQLNMVKHLPVDDQYRRCVTLNCIEMVRSRTNIDWKLDRETIDQKEEDEGVLVSEHTNSHLEVASRRNSNETSERDG